MISMPETLTDDPIKLKQLLLVLNKQLSVKDGQILHLQEENTLLRQRLFGRKSEQTTDPQSPQIGLFNEAENLAVETPAEDDEETVKAEPAKKRGKRKPLPAELPRVDVIHELNHTGFYGGRFI